MPAAPRNSFQVKLSKAQEEDLVSWVADEINAAIEARTEIIGDPLGTGGGDLDDWHKIYEGGDRNLTKQQPWPGAANLTSYIGTESVDAMRARIVQTIFTEPIWIVEGWGEAAGRASFVEEFHQWKAEEERLQSYLSRVLHNSLIEGTGVLEISEQAVLRKVRTETKAAVAVAEDGAQLIDNAGNLIPARAQDGSLVPADPGAESITITEEQYISVRRGPQYRVVALRDFYLLPGHASDRGDLWGYAKRIWRRVGELASKETLGIYKNVEELGEENERQVREDEIRFGQWQAETRPSRTSEKEIWEVSFLHDLDDDGVEEWYIMTLHREKRVMLRLQRDDIGQPRYLLFTPFPRPNSIYGYSLIGHKLGTIIDEHTAWRNMITDRAILAVNAPVKRLQGSLWKPEKMPWGPRQIIPVRDMREVEPVVMADVPGSAINRENLILTAAERIKGMNDVTLGSFPQADRTLGEVQLVTQQSFIRIEEIIKHLQETLEDLFQLRHSIYKRVLVDQPMPLPSNIRSVLTGVEDRGVAVPGGLITAALLEGEFRGKPRGSVESADLQRMRADFNGLLTAFTQLAQGIPMFQQILNNPEAAKAILNQALRVYRWPDKRALETAVNAAPMPPPGAAPGQQFPGAGSPPGGPPQQPPRPAQLPQQPAQGSQPPPGARAPQQGEG